MSESNSISLPDTPFTLGVVGAAVGRVRFGAGIKHLASLRIAGIVDADMRAARGWAIELPGKPAIANSVDKLLDSEPQLDGLIVCNPLSDRAAVIKLAAERNVAVLTEFPCTKTLLEMDELAAVAANSQVSILPAFPHRYEPAVIELESAAPSLGHIASLRCESSFPLSALFALQNGVVPVAIDWYDLLLVACVRSLDLSIRWLGRPVSVNADMDLPHHAAIAGRRATDPVANLIVGHENGQSTHLLRLSRSVAPGERYVVSGALGSLEYTRASGERGAVSPAVKIQLAGRRPETLYIQEDAELDRIESSMNLLNEFTRIARQGSPQLDGWQDSRMVLETIQAAFASARDGIRTPLPLTEIVNVDNILEGT